MHSSVSKRGASPPVLRLCWRNKEKGGERSAAKVLLIIWREVYDNIQQLPKRDRNSVFTEQD